MKKNFIYPLKYLIFLIKNHSARKNISNDILKNLRGKKVLVVGSGPSSADLSEMEIPDDYLILSANLAPNSFHRKNIFLYLTTSHAIAEGGGKVEEILHTRNFSNIIFNRRPSVDLNSTDVLRTDYFDSRDNFFTKTLLKYSFSTKKQFSILKNNPSQQIFPSLGIQLLQYALLGEAKEIVMFGIDTDLNVEYGKNTGYTKNSSLKINHHYILDSLVLEYVMKNNENVFVGSEKSPLSKKFPLKKLFN